MYILETARLTFRKMVEADVDLIMEIFSDPIAMQYYPSTYPREVALKWIHWNMKNYEEVGTGLWICELKDDRSFVGQCGIIPQIVDEKQEMEIGYLFVRKHWGKGLATEAAIATLNYGFKELGFSRLIATIYHKNEPSIRLAERIGMKFEKRTFVGKSDDVIYSIQKNNLE
ncbi:GNAT family N-acetyltransferase [Anaerobacillus sp. CMMVII]|uniref:GNAT family N-acetyltransferase n=1 Tax=Anaerobacillus sp. CMMVII TaxID=2755588 RepID=UPI0021B70D28|nr:GNAT family N-acetyltransferase [Anaerobacillus sp. CMMVII]MCT8138505.1 GNAT family N-acetyltransferase [Anaerobacillus sp. CMMVII]